MEFEARQVHVLGFAGGIQSVQHPLNAGTMLCRHALVTAFGKKQRQTLVRRKCWALKGRALEEKPTDLKSSMGSLRAFLGRGERIRTSGLYVPNVALYLTKLHPASHAKAQVYQSDQPQIPRIFAML